MQNTQKKMMGKELNELLKEAVEALKGPSTILEYAPKMSKDELQKQIDNRLDMIVNSSLDEEELEQAKAEARTLAILRLRRG